MDLVKPKGILKRESKTLKLIERVVEKIAKMTDYATYKSDIEMLKLICNMIEQEINNKNKKKDRVDKLAVVKTIYVKLFNLNANEIKSLETNIEYLIDNNQIKRKGVIILILKTSFNYIKSFIK